MMPSIDLRPRRGCTVTTRALRTADAWSRRGRPAEVDSCPYFVRTLSVCPYLSTDKVRTKCGQSTDKVRTKYGQSTDIRTKYGQRTYVLDTERPGSTCFTDHSGEYQAISSEESSEISKDLSCLKIICSSFDLHVCGVHGRHPRSFGFLRSFFVHILAHHVDQGSFTTKFRARTRTPRSVDSSSHLTNTITLT